MDWAQILVAVAVAAIAVMITVRVRTKRSSRQEKRRLSRISAQAKRATQIKGKRKRNEILKFSVDKTLKICYIN